ncbi:MAG: glutathione peroxidase [Flavobacteriales bacterium]|nr:glutathione peroxidase [Flavobacteriales bacterium]
MKVALIIVAVLIPILLSAYWKNNQRIKQELVSQTTSDFYQLSYTDINGKTVPMSDYKGKYVLIVNVASKCGNTPQYAALQQLQEKHKDKLVIIGFPCNQFLGQEPGSEKEIAEFCTKNYGVTFPLASKIDVKGTIQHPIFTWLTSKSLNGVQDDKVEWNFHKFLVGPDGKWLKSYSASMDPMNGEIEREF